MTRTLTAALLFASVVPAAGQAPAATTPPPTPKPGVPGVQFPMSRLVPDAEYAMPGGPDWLAQGESQVWTNNRRQNLVVRMDPDTNQTVAVVPVKDPCSGLIIAAGTLWAPSCTDGVIYRIDTTTNQVVAKVPVAPANNEGGIAYGASSIWMPTDGGAAVARIDAVSGDILATVPVAPGSYTAVFGYGRAWISSTEKSVVTVIHPATNAVIAEIPVDTAPRFMSAGEGYVWTLNQGKGTVTKIDPSTMKVVATIDVGVPGGGGDITADEGAVWVTARDIPLSRIDVHTERVTHQFVGPGGDGMRVLHGSVFLSNGRWNNVWRFQTAKVLDLVPPSWTSKAAPVDFDRNGTPDVLLEDLDVWFPGQPTTFRVKPLAAIPASGLTLKATLNGTTTDVPFVTRGDLLEASFTGGAPRWISYRVCAGTACSDPLVVASPTTPLSVALQKTRFVPADFMAPGPPSLDGYVWNILEPEILDPDYDALLNRAERTTPVTITKPEDYGELKRHEWEFTHHTAFAYGILSPDKRTELACVYINPSDKQGYDASVRFWVTKAGADAKLEPVLDRAVRQWIKEKWPFKSPAYPGRDMPQAQWNALPTSAGTN